MTASERLRALERTTSDSWLHEETLWDALSLIADVVEAAEEFVAKWPDPAHYPQLREPLTALREHLEGQ